MDIKTLEAFSLSDAVKFHDELNPKLWRNNELRPDVKKQLLLIAQDFMQELGLDDLKVEDITISGSNAAYTYTDHSDLDLHILVDFSKLPNNEVYQELFNAKKTLYNDNHDITVHGVPIELYVQDTNQVHHSLGEYSLKNNTWTRIPKKRKADLDQSATKLKYDKLYDLIHLALKSKNIEKINELLSTIKRYRQAGLDQGGEFSPENLAFKALRSQGLINKLYALKNKLHSDELTIEDYDPNGPPPGPEFPPTMPAGTVRVDVSDVYDWYKLGQHISNMKGLGKHDFGKGPPSTILSFGDEDTEHQYIQDLEKTGLSTTDIDPVDPHQPKGMKRQKVDTTYNVNESSFNKCFDKACEVYDKALKKNLKPVMYQVADYAGDAENADSKWQELPKHVWSHYVTVVNDIVLDPTAKQFGDDKPTKYSFDELQNNWKKIFKIRPKEIDESAYIGNLGISELTRLFIQHPELKPKFLEIKQKHGIEKAFMWAAENLGVKLQPIISKEQGVAESASGYIPSKKQANDPRFKTALTVDVKPDTIKKNAKAFGFKVSRAGIPPLLREDVSNDYLYHGTNAEAAKQILNTGNLTARVDTKQRASQGQTQDPTVSFTRSWDYLMNPVGGGRTFTTSYPVIFVFSRDKIEQKYKTMGTSQSYDWRGLPFVPDEVGTIGNNPPQSKAKAQVDLAKKWLDKNKDGRISKDEINAEIKRDPESDFIKVFRTKVAKRYGSEFEEIVPVKATGVAPDKRLDGATAPIGKLPTKDILVGFWVNPNSDAINDKQLMNDPLRLEIPGFKNTDKDKFYKHTFVRANKQTAPMATKTYDPVEKQKQSQLGAEKAKQIASRRADAMHAFNPPKEKSVAEQKNADKITAYHGTRRDIDKFKPFSHFGTFRAAYDRLDHTRRGDKNEIDNEQIYQVELDINNPIELDVDIFDNHKLSDYVELLQRKKVLDDSEVESIKSPSDLLKTLLGKGYDGIKYKNRWEHPGSISYVIFKPDQVRVSDIITHNQPNKFNRLLTKN